jgi:hypothetical protein
LPRLAIVYSFSPDKHKKPFVAEAVSLTPPPVPKHDNAVDKLEEEEEEEKNQEKAASHALHRSLHAHLNSTPTTFYMFPHQQPVSPMSVRIKGLHNAQPPPLFRLSPPRQQQVRMKQLQHTRRSSSSFHSSIDSLGSVEEEPPNQEQWIEMTVHPLPAALPPNLTPVFMQQEQQQARGLDKLV